ncbi:MAG: hypothetical protein OXI87_01150 [Albidovulum sp.]|nr:hypothetical protein [Albidovulum sp.]
MQVDPRHAGADSLARGHRQATRPRKGKFDYGGGSRDPDRRVNEARPVHLHGKTLAGRQIGSPGRPGTFTDVESLNAAGLPGQDAD